MKSEALRAGQTSYPEAKDSTAHCENDADAGISAKHTELEEQVLSDVDEAVLRHEITPCM